MSKLAVRVVADVDLTTCDWMILQDIATESATVVMRESASSDPTITAEALAALRAILRSQTEAA